MIHDKHEQEYLQIPHEIIAVYEYAITNMATERIFEVMTDKLTWTNSVLKEVRC
jgi:hypothetical protein